MSQRIDRTDVTMAAGRWLLPAAVAALVTSLIACVGATITDVGPWYQALAKPDWAPPDVLYAPAWILIFGLTAIAAATAWMATPAGASETVLGLFALNGFLNLLWSFLFFRLHRPDLAALEVWLLWASVAALIIVLRRFSRSAALLLLPYLAWVSFAGVLNQAVVALN